MSGRKTQSSEAAAREIRRRIRRRFPAEGKIRIVLEGLRLRALGLALTRRVAPTWGASRHPTT